MKLTSVRKLHNDPHWQLKLRDLQEIFKLIPELTFLSKVLGIHRTTFYQWIRDGQISAIGALLVAKSKILRYKKAKELRPDLSDIDWFNATENKYYKQARERQKAFENDWNAR